MLAYEWSELETLCERILTLRDRLKAAHRTGNTGLVEGLGVEMDRAVRQRDRLVRHISTRLGSAAASAAPADPPHTGSAGEPLSRGIDAGAEPTRVRAQPGGAADPAPIVLARDRASHQITGIGSPAI